MVLITISAEILPTLVQIIIFTMQFKSNPIKFSWYVLFSSHSLGLRVGTFYFTAINFVEHFDGTETRRTYTQHLYARIDGQRLRHNSGELRFTIFFERTKERERDGKKEKKIENRSLDSQKLDDEEPLSASPRRETRCEQRVPAATVQNVSHVPARRMFSLCMAYSRPAYAHFSIPLFLILPFFAELRTARKLLLSETGQVESVIKNIRGAETLVDQNEILDQLL